MKKTIKYALMLALLCVASTGCAKIWEQECTECIPLPDTEIPVTPDPWEPPIADDDPLGD